MTPKVASAPYDLDAEQQTSLRVVATPTPRLSWRLPGEGNQSAFEVEARVDGAVVSHRGDSGEHRMVPWPWRALRSRARVEWRVRAERAGAWSPWSPWAAFEAPLFEPADWHAEWISPAEDDVPGDRPAYVLTRDFDLQATPDSARLYASALGVYEAFLNGRRVGEIELAPGAANYHETLYAQAYEVTDQLRAGRNVMEIVLSDGWFRGRNGGGQRQNAWGAVTAALAQLEIVTPDGPELIVATDAGWSGRIGQITRADLMTGQTTDYSAPMGAPSSVRVGRVDPPVPAWSPAPPVRRVEELPAVTATVLAPGVSIVDFGQNISGWVRLADLGTAGAATVLEFGEHLDADGDLTTSHLDIVTPEGHRIPYRQIDRVIAGPTGTVFEPRHTVHGFRYTRIQHPGRPLDASSVTAVVVHSALERTSWFECSDPDLNRLHDATVWSFRGNVVDVPTDCPTRERSGWTGDFQVFAPTATFLYDIDGFARKWLRAVRDDQYDDGSLAMFSPDSELMKRTLDNPSRVGGGSAGWGDAAVVVPWALYESYGDSGVLAENWDSMQRWVEFALRCAHDGRHPVRAARAIDPLPHEQYIWDATFHFGEWLEPRPRNAHRAVDPAEEYAAFLTADNGEVATAYLYRSTLLLSRTAAVLGKTADADGYARAAESIRAAWCTEFLTGGGRTAQDTQAAYVRALAFDLILPHLRGAAAARLVDLVRAAGDRLTTGFLSTGMLLPVLADNGHPDTAYRLLMRRGTPSWLGMLDRGATTVWEDWEGVDDQGTATASLNHYSKGAVTRFLYSHVVGLQQAPDSTAWERFTVRPVLGGGVTHARARFLSPQGTISAAWRLSDDTFKLDVTVPAGSSATAILPDGRSIDLAAGPHQLSCETSPRGSTRKATTS